MTPERWGRIKEVFQAALERDEAERVTFHEAEPAAAPNHPNVCVSEFRPQQVEVVCLQVPE